MKQQNLWIIVLASLLTAVCAGCAVGCVVTGEQEVNPGSLSVLTWNVHNLFDGEDNGNEYNDFLQSSGWSAEKFIGRINTLSDAISRIKPQPDIILLQEVENPRAIEELAIALRGGYSWSHFAGNPGAAIGLGIISRCPLLEVKAHTITIDGDTSPRPVLEARIQPADTAMEEAFVIFICHWKSKLGGDEATESARRASAMVILRRIRELWENEPGLGVIVAGDLNLNHDEFYRHNASRICALLPDDPYSVLITSGVQKDFIVISRNKPPTPVHFPQETIVLYSPWISELENGSYYFRNNWETIDHLLVSRQFFDNTGWEYEKTVIINFPPFADSRGIPIPYNVRTGFGISDHLPLLMTLQYKN